MSCIDAAIIKALVEHIGMNPDEVGTATGNLLSQTYSPKDGVGFVEALGLKKTCKEIVWTSDLYGALTASNQDFNPFYNMILKHKFIVFRFKTVSGGVYEAIYDSKSGDNDYLFKINRCEKTINIDGQMYNLYITKIDDGQTLFMETHPGEEIITNDEDTGFFVLPVAEKHPTIGRLFNDLIEILKSSS